MRLIRHGFTDPDTAEQLLTGLDGGAEEAVLVALSDTADLTWRCLRCPGLSLG